MINAVFNGPPTALVAPSRQANVGLDAVNGVLYFTGPGSIGWSPISGSTLSSQNLTGQVANNANLLTYTVAKTGTYTVNLYGVSTNVPTGATLPAQTVTYTDAASNTVVTQTLADVTTVGAAGVVNQGQFVIRPLVGTNVVVASTSYAAGSGTALAYAAIPSIMYRNA